MHSTRRRNFETLVFIGKIYQEGSESALLEVLGQIKQRHAPYQIPNDLYLYTLSTFACLPKRLADRFGQQVDEQALEAQCRLWCKVGEKMGIEDIPSDLEAFLRWMYRFEAQHFRYTPDAEQVTRALAAEWADYWFPKAMQPLAIKLFFALIDQPMQRVLGVADEVSPLFYRMTTHGAHAYLAAINHLPDPRQEQHLADRFSIMA